MFSYPKEPNKMMISTSTTTNHVEEFSFPVVSNNPISNIMLTSSSPSSSSLWRISSRVYHHPEVCYYENIKEGSENVEDIDDDDDDDYRMEVRSMCEEIMPSSRREIERSASSVSFQSKDLEVQESMDYLWEDFNEEEKKEYKGRYSTNEDTSFKRTSNYKNSNSNSNSRNSSGIKMLVLGRFLKGLVSIRKSAQIKLTKSRF